MLFMNFPDIITFWNISFLLQCIYLCDLQMYPYGNLVWIFTSYVTRLIKKVSKQVYFIEHPGLSLFHIDYLLHSRYLKKPRFLASLSLVLINFIEL